MTPDVLKSCLRRSLRPAGAWDADTRAVGSDYDLNPGIQPPTKPLRAAAVLAPLVVRPEGVSVILTRRSDALASHSGQIAFPGGRLDPGETAVEAALREAREEVALDPGAVEVLGLGDVYETVTGFLVTPVIGWLEHPQQLTPSPDEVAEVFEAPWDFLMDAANHRRDNYVLNGATRWFWAMPWNDRYIWGATAGILRALSVRLGQEEAA